MVVFHALPANSTNQKKGTQMKCESCQNCKLSVDGIYYYCTCRDMEFDKDAAIIQCDDYKPYESEVSDE